VSIFVLSPEIEDRDEVEKAVRYYTTLVRYNIAQFTHIAGLIPKFTLRLIAMDLSFAINVKHVKITKFLRNMLFFVILRKIIYSPN
jgi:hypothetical protein